jgi:polypeptide N-acetylgalactosaminyltransferase
MVARTEGALIATGDTLTFLDSHIECNLGWAEPLMARIKQDKKHVVMPIIDSIDPDSFVYRGGGVKLLGFTWTLGQDHSINNKRPYDPVNPMESPVMAGGLFAMDRQVFYDLGTYDQEMRIYGGEEMEIGFRIWQCGYTLECVPCSRIGHIFRTAQYWKGQVYTVPFHEITRNKLRAAAVWMDEFNDIVVDSSPALPVKNPVGDISDRVAIRQTCLNGGPSHNFSWLLDNVYPELFVPSPDRLLFKGELKLDGQTKCVDSGVNTADGGVIGLYPCHGLKGTQDFMMTKPNRNLEVKRRLHEIRFGTDTSKCFDASQGIANGRGITRQKCHGAGGNQGWWWIPTATVLTLEDALDAQVVRKDNVIKEYKESAKFEYDTPGFLMTSHLVCLTAGPHGLREEYCESLDTSLMWRWGKSNKVDNH